MTVIAFIGLGNMGAPMAFNLLRAKYTVVVFDVNQAAAVPLVAEGAVLARSAVEAARAADVVISMLPNGSIVRSLFEGPDGVLASVEKQPVLIDCSTISPDDARHVVDAASEHGLMMVDAPVSGGVRGAIEGTLSFMVGGDQAAFERAKPILSAMGRSIFYVGAAGTGQAAKICNNMMAGILMAASAEVLALGVRNGLAPETLSEIMRHSSGGNFMIDRWNPWPGVDSATPASNGYAGGFQVNLMLKDLGLALQSAQINQSATPMGSMARNLFQLHALQATGTGHLDMSSIQRLYFP